MTSEIQYALVKLNKAEKNYKPYIIINKGE